MSVMLECYLEEVKQQLNLLPKKQRETELREIESHLHAMIEARQADGMLYGEAVSAAVRQFGCPHRVGRDLSRSWHDHQAEHPLRALAAAMGMIACQATLSSLYTWVTPLLHDLLYRGYPSPNEIALYRAIATYRGVGYSAAIPPPALDILFAAVSFFFLLTPPIVSGMVAHAIAPRRGWLAALTVYLSVFGGLLLARFSATPQPVNPLSLLEIWPLLTILLLVQFGSWWSKRRRLKKQARKADQRIVVVPSF